MLVTADHPALLTPLAQMVAGIGGAIERVLAACRSGGGVPDPMFGRHFAMARRASIVRRSRAIRRALDSAARRFAMGEPGQPHSTPRRR